MCITAQCAMFKLPILSYLQCEHAHEDIGRVCTLRVCFGKSYREVPHFPSQFS